VGLAQFDLRFRAVRSSCAPRQKTCGRPRANFSYDFRQLFIEEPAIAFSLRHTTPHLTSCHPEPFACFANA